MQRKFGPVAFWLCLVAVLAEALPAKPTMAGAFQSLHSAAVISSSVAPKPTLQDQSPAVPQSAQTPTRREQSPAATNAILLETRDCTSVCHNKKAGCDADCDQKRLVCVAECGIPTRPGYSACTQKCSDDRHCSLDCQANLVLCQISCNG